jgi:hypothetical protein
MRQYPFWKGAKLQEIDGNLQVLGAAVQHTHSSTWQLFNLLVLLLDSVLSNHVCVISAWRISSPAVLCSIFELNPYPALVFEEAASINNRGALLVPA